MQIIETEYIFDLMYWILYKWKSTLTIKMKSNLSFSHGKIIASVYDWDILLGGAGK